MRQLILRTMRPSGEAMPAAQTLHLPDGSLLSGVLGIERERGVVTLKLTPQALREEIVDPSAPLDLGCGCGG